MLFYSILLRVNFQSKCRIDCKSSTYFEEAFFARLCLEKFLCAKEAEFTMIVNMKYKHLTSSDRATIETMFLNGAPFRKIAVALDKDASTISREIRKHRVFMENRFIIYDEQNRILNNDCPRLDKPTYTCNACPKHRTCHCKRLPHIHPKCRQA